MVKNTPANATPSIFEGVQLFKVNYFKSTSHWFMVIWLWPYLLWRIIGSNHYSLWADEHGCSLAFDRGGVVVTPLKDVSAENTVFLGEIIDDDDGLS